jgi:hypothetical protein
VVAAAGVNLDNAANIILGASVSGVHAGSSVTKLFSHEGAGGSNNGVSMGSYPSSSSSASTSDLNTWPVVDSVLVSKLVSSTTAALAKRAVV